METAMNVAIAAIAAMAAMVATVLARSKRKGKTQQAKPAWMEMSIVRMPIQTAVQKAVRKGVKAVATVDVGVDAVTIAVHVRMAGNSRPAPSKAH